ncbi:SpoIIE family protein phosphatase [Streptomyces sp. CA-106131]|uniref:SpoIIE family protein phosphatase n=1 Tax=Streptomyces sp. CA-106131 TaxID=3240045 RepID=UPI003D8BECFC
MSSESPVSIPGRGRFFSVTSVATAVLDASGTVIGWSPAAAELFGLVPEEALGRRADAVLGEDAGGRPLFRSDQLLIPEGETRSGTRTVRHRDGGTATVAVTLNPLAHGDSGAAWLVWAVSVEQMRWWAVDHAMLTGFHRQAPILLTVYDAEARVRWINTAIEEQLGIPPEEVLGRFWREILPEGELLAPDEPADEDDLIRGVVRTGQPVIDARFRSPTPRNPHRPSIWSCSYFRLNDEKGRPIGAFEASFEITDRYVAQQRLDLLSKAGGRIGRSLDIRRTAEELADLVVPEFADAVAVELYERVLDGEEPGTWGDTERSGLRRIAERSVSGEPPVSPLDSVRMRCLARGVPVGGITAGELLVPVCARDTVLGLVLLARNGPSEFDGEEIALAEELVSRMAVCVDNARRFLREHMIALTLQRNLLPEHIPEPTGVEVAHRYAPAAGPAGVGGDWYDVIPLSGTRVGLVVGDVAGHGLDAAATMGRLRTTVQALATLDLAPDEVLSRLDDVVGRLGSQVVGVSCLYAVYDPVSRHCVMARAGHVPSVLVTPDGRAELLPLPAGPLLGLGGLPFETTEFVVPEGGLLALFTDGLVERRDGDIDIRIKQLCEILSRPARPLDQVCDEAMSVLLPSAPDDDAALLLVRLHAVPADRVVTWHIASDASEVAQARALACAQLAAWGYEDSAFVVELVVSELVTNAIRYGDAPVHLRLIRDEGLVCEVSDGGHTSPHLRRATNDEEGGRGLFLVAQLTERWGTRYTSAGKTIWTEVPAGPGRLPDLFADGLFTS